MRRWLVVSSVCVLAIGLLSSVRAQESGLAGDWHQIESNAGACPKCRVSIGDIEMSVRATANNGWSANLEPGTTNRVEANGTGVWAPGRSGTAAGRNFR